METTSLDTKPNIDRSWEKVVRKYNQSSIKGSIWQLSNTLIPYLALWILMYYSLSYSYLLTLLLALVACGFFIRLFIIFHDCGHGSFFKSRKANKIVGMIMGILTFTPYGKWHFQHGIHHATALNLDKRGIGDIWTLTKDEYNNASTKRKLIYRIARNPFVMFILGPLFLILVQNRITTKVMRKEDKQNIYLTNVILVFFVVGMIMLLGTKTYLLIQVPILYISHSIGIWLFFVQHNFEDILWERTKDWDYLSAALRGSSYLKLPKVFQWFTGNIGFHHVHHLSSRIPNYNLEQCHSENELFHGVKPIKFFSTFKYLNLHLWDEKNQRMISFKENKLSLKDK